MTYQEVSWETHKKELLLVRFEVFVDEQKVPPEEEVDDKDPASVHILAVDDSGTPVATGRLTPGGWIGRMAVRNKWRGTGTGFRILQMLIQKGRQSGHKNLWLSAQTHAIDFYARAGFTAEGEIYDDCGIPHRNMVLELAPEH